MRIWMLIVCCLLTLGCDSEEFKKQRLEAERREAERLRELDRYHLSEVQEQISSSVYVRDGRTGLCFNVMTSSGYRSDTDSHTVVPCDKAGPLLNKY